MTAAFVVSGPSGSGKTSFANWVASVRGTRAANVGDSLAQRLRANGVQMAEREQIGSAFLGRYGLSGYLEVVCDIALANDVLDGVRLAPSLEGLRVQGFEIVHFFRERPDGSLEGDIYEVDLAALRANADHIVPWLPTAGQAKCYWESHFRTMLAG